MPSIVNEDFHKSLRSSPSGQLKLGTVLDELYCALETTDRPLDRAIQTIAEFHGPYNGSSVEIADFINFLSAATGSSPLKDLLLKKLGDLLILADLVKNLPTSVDKKSALVFATMPTPLMREFINRSQKIHPSINMYIQMHIDTFPYYQPISEDVGQFVSVVMNATEIDPLKWLLQGGIGCLSTNSRMNTNTMIKMMPSIFQIMDEAQNLTNSLFLRASPVENNMGMLHQNYSEEVPIAHGHNSCMDVHNAKRKRMAIGPCAAVILSLAQDLLRLLNKFFCIKELSRYEVEGFSITMYEGPNGQPITYIADQNYRPLWDGTYTNNINDPTNDNVLGTKEKFKDELS